MLTERRLESPLGQWTCHVWRPAPGHPLASVVSAITHWDGWAALPRERLFPDTAVSLVVHLGEPHRLVLPSRSSLLPPACISGVCSRPSILEAPSGRASTLCLRLSPTGAHALLGLPLSLLSDQAMSLEDCLGCEAGALTAACADAPTPARRIEAAVAWLSSRLSRAEAGASAIAWAAREIQRHAGAVSIGTLQTRTGLSRARLAEGFRREVGVTPKRYARIARFRHALALLGQARTPALAEVALAAGYSDQAHMNLDFRQLGALTPGGYLAAVRPQEWVGMAEPLPRARTA